MDAIVVGAGVSGLVAGLYLQQRGHSVVLLEARGDVGGLCGTHEIDGLQYAIACHDFGAGIVPVLRSLGVQLPFESARSRFLLEEGSFDVPPRLRDIARLFPALPEVLKVRDALREGSSELTLGGLVEARVTNPLLGELLGALGYVFAVAPRRLSMDSVAQELASGASHGYTRPVFATGGAVELARALASAFQRAGGVLHRGLAVTELGREKEDHVAVTATESFVARVLLTSQGRWDVYPENLRPGLSAALIHLALDPWACKFPSGVQTLTHVPRGAQTWLDALDGGELPDAFGFHITRSGLPLQEGLEAANVAFLMPRGCGALSEAERRRVTDYLFGHCDRMIPGFEPALACSHMISPDEFERRHGRSSRVAPFEPGQVACKPDIFDPSTERFHLGNSVGCGGDHVGAAISASLAAAAGADVKLHR